MYRHRQEQLQRVLERELYLRVKSYGWMTFQVNSKRTLNAMWSIDKSAKWNILLCEEQESITLNVSQPFVDQTKCNQTNKVEVDMRSTTFNFSGFFVARIVFFSLFFFSTIIFTYNLYTLFYFSAAYFTSCAGTPAAGARLQRIPCQIEGKTFSKTSTFGQKKKNPCCDQSFPTQKRYSLHGAKKKTTTIKVQGWFKYDHRQEGTQRFKKNRLG